MYSVPCLSLKVIVYHEGRLDKDAEVFSVEIWQRNLLSTCQFLCLHCDFGFISFFCILSTKYSLNFDMLKDDKANKVKQVVSSRFNGFSRYVLFIPSFSSDHCFKSFLTTVLSIRISKFPDNVSIQFSYRFPGAPTELATANSASPVLTPPPPYASQDTSNTAENHQVMIRE